MMSSTNEEDPFLQVQQYVASSLPVKDVSIIQL